MKCAVITPVGPGHEYLSPDALDSAQDAFTFNRGPFSELVILKIDDTQGKMGRSAARNSGVETAMKNNIDWVFFLDADDVMLPSAFADIDPYIRDFDAIFGQICCMGLHDERFELRPGQMLRISSIDDLLIQDPVMLLQIGHFVRTSVAHANLFDVNLDTGEDFDYFLRVWSAYRCTKIGSPLFINRQGAHSIGPRSATGREWLAAVRQIRNAYQNLRRGP